MNKKLPISELVPLICEVISSGGEFRLFPRGTSMLPLIKEGRDSVFLIKPDNINKNDIALYQRKNGQYVLHRIVNIDNDEFIMCGDNQFVFEYGINKSMIIAKVSAVDIDGNRVSVDSKHYKNYLKTLKVRRIVKRFKSFCNRGRNFIRRKLLIEK